MAQDSASSKGNSRGGNGARGNQDNKASSSKGGGNGASASKANYSSGASGSRFGGASTQRPGAGLDQARLGAISRGPGIGKDPRAAAMTAVNAFAERPAGIRTPEMVSSLARAALNGQRLFSVSGATPTQQALVDRISPTVLQVSARTGLDPRTVLGQALTESAKPGHPTGLSGLARNFNNLFGYKVGSGISASGYNKSAPGAVANLPTTEYVNGRPVRVSSPFRSYGTPEQSVEDYGDLVSRNYSSAAKATTPEGQLAAIRSGGYATHPASGYVSMASNMAGRISPGGSMQPASYSPAAGTPPQSTTPAAWAGAKGWFEQKTGVNVGQAVKQLSEGNKKVASLQSNPVGRMILTAAGVTQPTGGQAPASPAAFGRAREGGRGASEMFVPSAPAAPPAPVAAAPWPSEYAWMKQYYDTFPGA